MSYTPEQMSVIRHAGGHALVGAVAGSGKTHTMIGRVAHLLDDGADPRRILILMFNKSARDDFERRLHAVLKPRLGVDPPEVLTFHAFGLRLCGRLVEQGRLWRHSSLLKAGYDDMRLAREAIARHNEVRADEDPISTDGETVSEFLSIIDLLKGAMYRPGEDFVMPDGFPEFDPRFLLAFNIFERLRRDASVRTFSDMIYDPVCAALDLPDVARYTANRYDHIIVDEFQDINETQMCLLRLVAGDRAKVMAVGDEDQTIYAWRGARPEYMTELFCEEFPGATRYTLSMTFRYGHRLSLVANNVITRNTARTDKISVSAESCPDTRVDLCFYQQSSGDLIADHARNWARGGRKLSEIAVLVREYDLSIPAETALHTAGIPYRVVGAPPFYDRREVLALRGYLLIAGHHAPSSESPQQDLMEIFSAMLSLPGLYIQRDLVEEFSAKAASHPERFIDLATIFIADLNRQAQHYTARGRIEHLDVWRWCAAQSRTMPAASYLEQVLAKTGLARLILKSTPRRESGNAKVRMIQQVVELAKSQATDIDTFSDYLSSLATHADATGDESVLITSVHRAKGREWPLVMVPELAEGAFPSISGTPSHQEIEDERRLFYVAITRAKEQLVLMAPLDPLLMSHQVGAQQFPPPGKTKASRFLYEGRIHECNSAVMRYLSGQAPTTSNGGCGNASSIFSRYFSSTLISGPGFA